MSPRNPDLRPPQDPNIGGGVYDPREITHMMRTILEAEGYLKPETTTPNQHLESRPDQKPKK